jgi:hypothetical protein
MQTVVGDNDFISYINSFITASSSGGSLQYSGYGASRDVPSNHPTYYPDSIVPQEYKNSMLNMLDNSLSLTPVATGYTLDLNRTNAIIKQYTNEFLSLNEIYIVKVELGDGEHSSAASSATKIRTFSSLNKIYPLLNTVTFIASENKYHPESTEEYLIRIYEDRSAAGTFYWYFKVRFNLTGSSSFTGTINFISLRNSTIKYETASTNVEFVLTDKASLRDYAEVSVTNGNNYMDVIYQFRDSSIDVDGIEKVYFKSDDIHITNLASGTTIVYKSSDNSSLYLHLPRIDSYIYHTSSTDFRDILVSMFDINTDTNILTLRIPIQTLKLTNENVKNIVVEIEFSDALSTTLTAVMTTTTVPPKLSTSGDSVYTYNVGSGTCFDTAASWTHYAMITQVRAYESDISITDHSTNLKNQIYDVLYDYTTHDSGKNRKFYWNFPRGEFVTNLANKLSVTDESGTRYFNLTIDAGVFPDYDDDNIKFIITTVNVNTSRAQNQVSVSHLEKRSLYDKDAINVYRTHALPGYMPTTYDRSTNYAYIQRLIILLNSLTEEVIYQHDGTTENQKKFDWTVA